MDLTSRQFKRFSDLVYCQCGIHLHDGKKQLLSARLAKRLRQTKIDSIDGYLKRLENDPQELIDFLDVITTNHTYFFRESQHFEILDNGPATIWSAASSSGEEAYSIAIYCLEKGFKPSILATDISTSVLRAGQTGVYPLERVRSVEARLLHKYFQKGNGKWSGHVRVKNEIRRLVAFKRFNLISDPLPQQLFDVIFCRNVLIYFDNQTKAKVVGKLMRAIEANGLFVIGGAESLNTIRHAFSYVKPSVYRKPGAGANA